jgi:DNA replication protein DnaC
MPMNEHTSPQAALLTTYLQRLRLPAMLQGYPALSEAAAREGLPYERFLLLLAERELAARDEHLVRQRLGQAKFPALKTFDQYDFARLPSLNRQLILELAQGRYLEHQENVLLVGDIGTGKTHLATALGVAACQQGRRVRFFTAAGLTNALVEAQAAHRLATVERSLLRLHLLILDEVGFVPFTKTGADLLFSCLSALHDRVSLVLTTTVPFTDWAALFGGDARLAAALLDRLAFHAQVVAFTGGSYRLAESLRRQTARTPLDGPGGVMRHVTHQGEGDAPTTPL